MCGSEISHNWRLEISNFSEGFPETQMIRENSNSLMHKSYYKKEKNTSNKGELNDKNFLNISQIILESGTTGYFQYFTGKFSSTSVSL